MKKKRDTSNDVTRTAESREVPSGTWFKKIGEKGYLRMELPGKSNNLNNYSVSTKDFLIMKIARRESA